MYLYFDSNGVLKEIITERQFRQGDSQRDKIYIYVDEMPSQTKGYVKYKLPNGTNTIETEFYSGGELVGKELPTEPARNLKFFDYNHTYEKNGQIHTGYLFYEITVPDNVLSSSLNDDNIPTQNNMVACAVRFIKNDVITQLGLIVFSVESTMGIITDESINETQYNYLLKYIDTINDGFNDTIKVIDNASVDVSEYNIGQVFFTRDTKAFYIKTNGSITLCKLVKANNDVSTPSEELKKIEINGVSYSVVNSDDLANYVPIENGGFDLYQYDLFIDPDTTYLGEDNTAQTLTQALSNLGIIEISNTIDPALTTVSQLLSYISLSYNNRLIKFTNGYGAFENKIYFCSIVKNTVDGNDIYNLRLLSNVNLITYTGQAVNTILEDAQLHITKLDDLANVINLEGNGSSVYGYELPYNERLTIHAGTILNVTNAGTWNGYYYLKEITTGVDTKYYFETCKIFERYISRNVLELTESEVTDNYTEEDWLDPFINISYSSGTITSPIDKKVIRQSNCYIKYGEDIMINGVGAGTEKTLYRMAVESTVDGDIIYFVGKESTAIDGQAVKIMQDIISVNATTWAYQYTQNTLLTTYSKSQIDALLQALPTPMQFKGTVGTSGTIAWASLPSASSSNSGYVYKVITDHNTSPICKSGDTIISNGNEWVVIPSGDEPSGTVTNVGASGSNHISVSGSPITTSGTLNIGVENGYQIPSNAQMNNVDKNLYNLGAYDTLVDNGNGTGTITRQTGYAIFDGSDDENWQSWDADNFRISVPNLIQAGDSTGLVCSNRYKESSNWSSQQKIGIFNGGGNVPYQIFIRDNNYNLSQFKESLRSNPLVVQYKTETSYTEQVILNQPLNTLDQNGSQWLRKEWEKGVNLANPNQFTAGWYYDNGNYTSSANDTCIIDYLEVKGGTKYTLSFDVANENIILWYDSTKTLISRQRVTALTNTITLPTNAKYIRYAFKNTVSKVMLNEGDHAYPYQAYNGNIVREKDITPVLLWENSSPNSAYAEDTLTITNLSSYKYLILEYKKDNNFNGLEIKKIVNESNQFILEFVNSNGDTYTRQINIYLSDSEIYIHDALASDEETVVNTANIPVRIYGTNIL